MQSTQTSRISRPEMLSSAARESQVRGHPLHNPLTQSRMQMKPRNLRSHSHFPDTHRRKDLGRASSAKSELGFMDVSQAQTEDSNNTHRPTPSLFTHNRCSSCGVLEFGRCQHFTTCKHLLCDVCAKKVQAKGRCPACNHSIDSKNHVMKIPLSKKTYADYRKTLAAIPPTQFLQEMGRVANYFEALPASTLQLRQAQAERKLQQKYMQLDDAGEKLKQQSEMIANELEKIQSTSNKLKQHFDVVHKKNKEKSAALKKLKQKISKTKDEIVRLQETRASYMKQHEEIRPIAAAARQRRVNSRPCAGPSQFEMSQVDPLSASGVASQSFFSGAPETKKRRTAGYQPKRKSKGPSRKASLSQSRSLRDAPAAMSQGSITTGDFSRSVRNHRRRGFGFSKYTSSQPPQPSHLANATRQNRGYGTIRDSFMVHQMVHLQRHKDEGAFL
ncbi:MAG: hypothetical protein MHM6MM_003578 [Cercozoa sp. M6MM]